MGQGVFTLDIGRVALMGQLDTQTLLFTSIFICFLMSFLMMLAALQAKRDPCLLWIASGFSILGFAILIIALPSLPSWLILAIWLSNMLVILTHGCIWSALRQFSGKKMRWGIMLLGPTIWTLFCLWPAFNIEHAWRVLAYTIIATSYYVFALKEMWPIWRQNAQAAVPLAAVLLFIIAFYLYRLAMWESHVVFWSLRPDAQATLFITMILVICLGFTSLILVRGREEYRYKLASLQDSLTQLPNRRALFEHATIKIDKALHQHQEVTLLMCDLDLFKQINDRYGHDIGDRVLKLFATVLDNTVGQHGFYARIGGEEFVVLCIGKTLPEVKALALGIQDELARSSNQELSFQVSTSIGIAQATLAGYSLHRLLTCADSALYQAKADNRDCVRIWSGHNQEDQPARSIQVKSVAT